MIAEGTRAPIGPETFGERLKRLRKERRISQVEMARLLNVTKPSVWKWETDKVYPRVGALEKLSEILQVSHKCLLIGGENDHASETTPEAREPAETFAQAIVECKSRLSRVAGVPVEKITITLIA
jgi:transcriptional regulator with XRE-family HTH domain